MCARVHVWICVRPNHPNKLWLYLARRLQQPLGQHVLQQERLQSGIGIQPSFNRIEGWGRAGRHASGSYWVMRVIRVILGSAACLEASGCVYCCRDGYKPRRARLAEVN